MKKLAQNRQSRSSSPFAKRSLGQNFLVDLNVVKKIVAALGPIEDDLVIEIGPGRGALTQELAAHAKRFIGIELDRVFARNLAREYRDEASVRIVEGDVLLIDFAEAASGFTDVDDIKIVANLPYNISTAVLEKLAGVELDYSQAVLMFQKEVVSRITARPGNRDRGYLTVITEASFETELLFDVHPRSFKPAPRVRSAVVRVKPLKNRVSTDPTIFRAVVSAGFRQKRKTIANNIKQIAGIDDAKALLSNADVDPKLRPEALAIEDWMRIASLISLKKADQT